MEHHPTAADFDSIRDYLDERLSTSEKNKFENDMKTNDEIREMVEFTRIMNFTIRHEQEIAMYHKISAMTEKWMPDSAPQSKWKIGKSLKMLLIAGVVAILAISSIFIWQRQKHGQSVQSEYYQNNLQPYPMLIGTGNLPANSELTKAITAYNASAFKDAKHFFEEYEQRTPGPAIAFYAGVSFLMDDDPATGMKYLEPLLSQDVPGLNEAVKWYAALGYIALQEDAKARELLDAMLKSPEFGEKSRRLLRDMSI